MTAAAYPRTYSTLVAAPETEPISLEEAKQQLLLDEGLTAQDALIASLITAARQHVEAFLDRALITQTWDLYLDAFPCGDIELVKPPVISVTYVKYIAGDGALTTWDTADYETELPGGPRAQRGRIFPAYGGSYPATRGEANAVTVRCVHGYGAASDVPDGIKVAMKLLIAHWYENREAVAVGTIAATIPMAVETLLWPFRAF